MISKEEVLANLEVISATIDNFREAKEVGAIVEYLGDVVSLQALASETQASAKFLLLSEVKKQLDKQIKATLEKGIVIPASVAKLRADSECAEYNYLYEKAQRLSSSLSHTIEGVRTNISYLKQERENSKYA